jgi:hypothetical protein
MVLCPSTPFFLLSLVTFIIGIWKINTLHTEDLDIGAGYMYAFTVSLISIDWRNIMASLQLFLPSTLWAMTVIVPVMHWCFKLCFPGLYKRYQESRLRAAERGAKESQNESVDNRDIEAAGERLPSELTPLAERRSVDSDS